MKKNSLTFAVIYTSINIITFVMAIIILKQQIRHVSFYFATLCNIIIAFMVTLSYLIFNRRKGNNLVNTVGSILPIGFGMFLSSVLFRRHIFIYSIIVYVLITCIFLSYGFYLLLAFRKQQRDNKNWAKLIKDVKK